jgi:exodeoxyribonuclease VII large subunit
MSRKPFDPKLVKVDPEEQRAADPNVPLTVTQLTRMVKRALEQHLPATVHVVGEISNFKRHSSGHLYFVLKDEHCELGCVMWRSAATSLKFEPTDGLQVLVTGQVDVFERSGRYQLYARRLEPRGVGALELAFRQLREKLEKEGLFDARRKRPLPPFPERIAVVTSPTGAAVRDILQTLQRRFPCVHVFLYPVTVQGPTAAGEIAGAIGLLNAKHKTLGGIDVMIVGRGGGSLEDLWAFNEEVVARAIFKSEIPVVSAVGHEVDVSISDLVADLRAPTPTAAAEIVVPVRDELLDDLREYANRLTRILGHTVALRRAALDALTRRRPFHEPLFAVRSREQALDELATRLQGGIADRLHRWHRQLNASEVALQRIRPSAVAARLLRRVTEVGQRLQWSVVRAALRRERRLAAACERFAALDPKHRVLRLKHDVDHLARRLEATSHKTTLRRGFSITKTKKDKAVVRDPQSLRDGDVLVTETARGEFESRVVNLRQLELFE